MQAQASVHDNSLTLQRQEADLQAVFMVCRQWALLIPLVQHPRSSERVSGSHHHPSPTHFPLAVVIAERLADMASESLPGDWHTECAAGDHQRWAAVHRFSVFSYRTPSTQLFTCILTNKLRRIHDLTMSVPYIICCCTKTQLHWYWYTCSQITSSSLLLDMGHQ